MSRPHVLLFDYGNTLIAFGPDQQAAQRQAIGTVLHQELGPYDASRLETLRKEQVLRPYHRDYVENDWRGSCHEIVHELYGHAPEPITEKVMRARYQAFLDSVSVDPAIPALLERLAAAHRLGLISNYPCADSIRDSLRALGLLSFFEVIVVSGEVGRVKPHPAIYQAALDALCCAASDCAYVGDNWLADVQGSKRLGMRAVLVKEHIPYESFEPQAGDHAPDAVVDRVVDLESVLEAWA